MNEVQSLFSKIKSDLGIYSNGLEKYTQEQFFFKHSEEVWSLAEMYHHVLGSAKNYSLKNAINCINKQEGQIGGDLSPNGASILAAGGLPQIKIKNPIPSKMEVNEVGYYKNKTQELISELEIKAEIVLADDGSYKISHPILGFLSAIQWIQFIEMHNRHHLTQKKELEAFAGVV
ncbi:MAG: hypothetical protein ACRCVT_08255 [Leadbetterella sp.]